MTDNDIYRLLTPIIESGLISMGFVGAELLQGYQPTSQGVPESPVVYINKISAPRYGHPGSKTTCNEITDEFETVESFWRTPKFQINGLAIQDVNDSSLPTASDLVEAVADILQTEATRQALLASGVGIIRIQDVRVTHFVDDKNRFEQSPSFDFELSYQNEIVTTVPKVDTYGININRI